MQTTRGWTRGPGRAAGAGWDGAVLAGERAGDYDPSPAARQVTGPCGPDTGGWGLAAALAGVEAAVAALAAVDLDGEDDRAVLEATLAAQRCANQLAGAHLGLLDDAERRQAYGLDGAVTLASWYRTRARLDHAGAHRLVTAARRLPRLPGLQAALRDGDVTVDHVVAVTRSAVPRRMTAIAEADPILAELARRGTPTDLRRAVGRIIDIVDPDGADSQPITDHGPDERRELHLSRGVDGLWNLRAVLDALDGELLAALLDAHDTPDPADTPEHLRRCPAQRRADAFGRVLRDAQAATTAADVHGAPPHILALVDIATLAGADDEATVAPRMRYGGDITPAQARRLAQDARITAAQTMGPWRAVSLGRTHRVLPSWLRGLLHLLHRRCRGPDCDRPAAWTQAHHQTPWADGGPTDLNATIPLCQAHHDLATTGRWHVLLDPDTGTCTWTGPTGQTIHTRPHTE